MLCTCMLPTKVSVHECRMPALSCGRQLSSCYCFAIHSPHIIYSLTDEGYVYDCTRDDGLPFHGAVLDIKYHAIEYGEF